MSGTISSVQVRLNGLSHTDPDDLDMVLVSPDGTAFVFWSDVGGVRQTNNACPTAPFACSISNFTITVSDSGTTLLPDGNGGTGQDAGVLANNTTYRPANHGTGVDSFPDSGVTVSAANSAANSPTFTTGLGGTATFTSRFGGSGNVNGEWRLYIALDSCCGPTGSDPGSLASWSLILTTNVANAATTTSLTSTVNPSFVGNNVTITATVTSGGNPVTLGAVSFFDGQQTLAANVTVNASGQASFTTSAFSEGSRVITANYSGATGFGNSSGTLTQVVDRPTTVTGNTFCNVGPITIPNAIGGSGTPYPSRLFVTGLAGTTQKVTMQLNGFTHPVPEDVDLLLVSPTGQKFVPFASVAGIVGVTNIDLTLDDAAAGLMPSSGSLAGGTYRPSAFASATFPSPAPAGPYQFAASQGSATFINTFSGSSPNGTWQLFASSHGAGTTGTRQFGGGWCLNFTTSSDPATTTTPSVSPSPSAVSQTVTVSALVANATTADPVNGQGTVNFTVGNTQLAGPLPLDANGVASFTKSDFGQGAHFVTANYNGSPGNFGVSNGTVLHYVDAPTTNPSTLRYCNSSAVTFPNVTNRSGSPYPTRILVSGLAGTINKVTVELNGLSHLFPDDIDMMLSGPNGNSLVLFSDVGSSTAVNGLNLVLDSSAAQALPDATALSAGTFRPSDFQVGTDVFAAPAPRTSAFSASTSSLETVFANSNGNGFWTLYTTNDSAGTQGGGSLANGWCLNFTMNNPDLTISKSHVGNFTQGQVGAEYTVVVGSRGPGTTSGTITVVENVPAGLTVTGMSGDGWDCTVGTLTCTTSAVLPANGTLPAIRVVVSVASNASSPLVPSATVSGGGAANSPTASDSTVIAAGPDLIAIVTADRPAAQGAVIQMSFTVRNVGGAATTGSYTLTAPMPTGLRIDSIFGANFACAASGGTNVSCSWSSVLAAGGEIANTFLVQVTVDAPLSVTTTATVSGGGELNTSNNSGSLTFPVEERLPDLVVTKVAEGGPFRQGGTVSYRITVTNSGNGSATGAVTLQDPIPAGLTVTGINGGLDWTCTNEATVTCTTTRVNLPSTSRSILLTASIAANAPASITNVATASNAREVATNNNSGESVITVEGLPDLVIEKASQSIFVRGGTASYTLTVTNLGRGATTGSVVVSDPMPTGLTVATTPSGMGWDCSASTTTNVSCVRTTSIAGNNASAPPITFNVSVAGNAPPSLTNTATVSTTGELITGNNNGAHTTSTVALTDVTISVPAGVSYTFNGQTVTGSQTFQVAPGTYVLSTTTPQTLGAGTRAVFGSWSNGGAISQNVVVGSSALTITGNFTTQHELTMVAGTGGTVTPASGSFFDAGTVVNVSATASSGFTFASWTGPVANANAAATTVTMSAPVSVTANFTAQTGVTISVPAGVSYTFNGQTVTGSQTFQVAPGTYVLSTTTPQTLGAGTRAVFASWSNGGAISQNVVVGSSALTITGTFTTQHQLTTAAGTGGTVTPASGTFFDAGTVVNVSATASSGFNFASWTGPVANANAAATTVTMSAPVSVTANFTALTGVTVNVPAGVSFTLNSVSYTGSQTVNLAPGSYTLATTTPQTLAAGTRAVFGSWSDGGAISNLITVGASPLVITGSFTTQHQLTTAAGTGGTVTPASGTFFDAGTVVNVSATASSGFTFASWTGPVANANAAATTVTMSAPVSVTANFTAQTGVTISVPAGVSYTFNGQTVTGSQTFQVAPGTYVLSTTTPQTLGAGTRAVFGSWSNGGAISQNVVVGSSALTITGNFATQHQLTTAAGTGGTVTPASGSFFDAGTVVNVSATASSGFVFGSWSGPVANANAAATTVTMSAPVSVTANFTAQTGVTISVPAGLSYTFNGQTVTGSQTFQVAPGTYVLSTTTPQTLGAGTRAVFASWSNGGAISQNVVVGSSALTITGTFTTQHQLTTAAGTGGTVTPASGTFFDAGTVVNVSATPSSGFNFTSWTGPVANPGAASTSVTISGPITVSASFTAAATTLNAAIAAKSGPANARVWSVAIQNTGAGAAVNAQLNTLSLTQTFGAACTPVVLTALPGAAGTIAPAGSAIVPVTIDFSACAVTSRFRVDLGYSANSGSTTGVRTITNQFQ
jgi:uncharacterized repeat protein (TIGR01451 family)